MKILLILAMLLATTPRAIGWSCDTSLQILKTDKSERDKCLYRMLNHYIEFKEVSLLRIYKENLKRGERIAGLFGERYDYELRRIKLYYEILDRISSPADTKVFITNTQPLPLQCPTQ